jgi:hypothetical protein
MNENAGEMAAKVTVNIFKYLCVSVVVLREHRCYLWRADFV